MGPGGVHLAAAAGTVRQHRRFSPGSPSVRRGWQRARCLPWRPAQRPLVGTAAPAAGARAPASNSSTPAGRRAGTSQRECTARRARRARGPLGCAGAQAAAAGPPCSEPRQLAMKRGRRHGATGILSPRSHLAEVQLEARAMLAHLRLHALPARQQLHGKHPELVLNAGYLHARWAAQACWDAQRKWGGLLSSWHCRSAAGWDWRSARRNAALGGIGRATEEPGLACAAPAGCRQAGRQAHLVHHGLQPWVLVQDDLQPGCRARAHSRPGRNALVCRQACTYKNVSKATPSNPCCQEMYPADARPVGAPTTSNCVLAAQWATPSLPGKAGHLTRNPRCA